jgi:hypothetical protein
MGALLGTGYTVLQASTCVCIPGRLINTIRVVCASYEDYSHWLFCLRTVSCRDGPPLLPSPESFQGFQGPTEVRF